MYPATVCLVSMLCSSSCWSHHSTGARYLRLKVVPAYLHCLDSCNVFVRTRFDYVRTFDSKTSFLPGLQTNVMHDLSRICKNITLCSSTQVVRCVPCSRLHSFQPHEHKMLIFGFATIATFTTSERGLSNFIFVCFEGGQQRILTHHSRNQEEQSCLRSLPQRVRFPSKQTHV